MTYAELWDAAGRVSAWLVAHGVVADCVVALQLDRSLEQVVGVVGVLRSGGAYLPLDAKWPLERRRFMMEDAACGWLVGQSTQVAAHASWFEGACLVLDDARGLCLNGSAVATSVPASVTPAGLAYVIFTSGSTGKPKGIVHAHAGYLVGLVATSAIIFDVHLLSLSSIISFCTSCLRCLLCCFASFFWACRSWGST